MRHVLAAVLLHDLVFRPHPKPFRHAARSRIFRADVRDHFLGVKACKRVAQNSLCRFRCIAVSPAILAEHPADPQQVLPGQRFADRAHHADKFTRLLQLHGIMPKAVPFITRKRAGKPIAHLLFRKAMLPGIHHLRVA